MAKKYDAVSGKWVDVPESNTPAPVEETPEEKVTTTQAPVTQKSEGQSTKANKNFTEQELTYLTGDMEVLPTAVTLALEAGSTISADGLGKYLSGMYYVTEVTVNISTSGVSLKYSVLRNGFGKTLKPYTPQAENSQTTDIAVLDTNNGVLSLAANDKVKFVSGVDAIYSNASEGVKVPAWVKEKTHTVSKVSDDGQRVLLKEIFSWTYTKYLQKV